MKAKLFLAAAAIVAVSATAQAQEARYEFEKAVITTKAEMMGQPMVTTYYIDDYGKKEASEFTMAKLGIAFAVSVLMNSIFAPVMMTFHKCTDIHITDNGGTVRGLLRPTKMREIFAHKVNWDMQWNFVIKKTIPLFWFPAHTITFILPPTFQVLFAALLGVALGLILAIKK